MKRRRITTLGLLAGLAFGLAAGIGAQDFPSLKQAYLNAQNDAQRLEVMQSLATSTDAGFGPFLVSALGTLASQGIESGNANDVQSKINLARLIITKAGDMALSAAKPFIGQIYRAAKDPFLAGDAALALGKLGASEFGEMLSRDLQDINLRPDLFDTRAQEVRASYLVQSLALLKDPHGLEPVFIASFSWYSPVSKVKESALTAFLAMSDDPSAFLTGIIKSDTSIDTKLHALDAEDASKASSAAKTLVAQAALDKGLVLSGGDVMSRLDLFTLRTHAIRLLATLGDSSPDGAALLVRSVKFAFNADEILASYAALGRNGSTVAVDFLISQLGMYNHRQQQGVSVSDDERKFIRQIIQSISKLKPAKAKSVLTEAQFSGYGNLINSEAKDALTGLPN